MREFIAQLRAEVITLEKWGAHAQAAAVDTLLAELESYLRQYAAAALTMEEAAAESGYSYSAIQKKVSTGELENVGTKGRPRVLRHQLPRKGGSRNSQTVVDELLTRRLTSLTSN
jgi:hypothetical protein